MLRKLFSPAGALTGAVLLTSALVAGAAAQNYTNSAAHENEVQRGAPFIDALNTLEAQGYASFSNFQQQGDKYTADAVKDGQTMHVIIDPMTHQVTNAGSPQGAAPQIQSGGAR